MRRQQTHRGQHAGHRVELVRTCGGIEREHLARRWGCRDHELTDGEDRPASARPTHRLGAADWIAIRRRRRPPESLTPLAGCGPTNLRAPRGCRCKDVDSRDPILVRRARRLRRRRRRRPLLQVLACHVRLAGRRHDAAGSERTRGRERRTSLRVRDHSGSGCVRWSTSRVRRQDHRPPRSRCHAQESPLAERPFWCRGRRTPRLPRGAVRHRSAPGLISGFRNLDSWQHRLTCIGLSNWA